MATQTRAGPCEYKITGKEVRKIHTMRELSLYAIEKGMVRERYPGNYKEIENLIKEPFEVD